MKFLLKRAQTSGRFRSVVFRLWGKVDLGGDESEIIDPEDFDLQVQVFSDQANLMRIAIGAGFAVAVVLYFVHRWTLASFGTVVAPASGGFAVWFAFDRFP